MLQRYLTEKPTSYVYAPSIETMDVGRCVVPKQDRVAVAGAAVRDFEEKWQSARR